MSAPTIPLDPILDAILALRAETLTAKEVADVLETSESSVRAALSNGNLPGFRRRLRVGVDEAGPGTNKGEKNQRLFIHRSALIGWVWDHATGDRSMMRAALVERAPKLLAVLERRDAERDAEARGEIIPMHGPAKAARAVKRPSPTVTNAERQDLFSFAS